MSRSKVSLVAFNTAMGEVSVYSLLRPLQQQKWNKPLYCEGAPALFLIDLPVDAMALQLKPMPCSTAPTMQVECARWLGSLWHASR